MAGVLLQVVLRIARVERAWQFGVDKSCVEDRCSQFDTISASSVTRSMKGQPPSSLAKKT